MLGSVSVLLSVYLAFSVARDLGWGATIHMPMRVRPHREAAFHINIIINNVGRPRPDQKEGKKRRRCITVRQKVGVEM